MSGKQSARMWPTALAGALAAVLAFAPALGAYASVTEHIVRKGETLYAIARIYGSSVAALAASNNLADPDLIFPGQRLKIPPSGGVVHRVERGDTLWQIAQDYGISLTALQEANPGLNPRNLAVGAEVIVPGVARSLSSRQAGGMSLAWPVSGRISSGYGWRGGRMHYGLDIAAPQGSTVVAAAPGRVVSAGWNGGYGRMVLLEHDRNLRTLYAHCSSLLVKPGQQVQRGQAIAKVGATGNATGSHLHFEVHVGGRPQNPLRFLP